jgi:hypothetical protein
MNDRPAVKAALSAGKEMREDLAKLNKDEWSKLFGTKTKDK